MSTSGSARDLGLQVIHYMRKTFNYDDTGITTSDTVKVGRLPSGAFIIAAKIRVDTAFNAGTTNPVTVGINATSNNNIIASGDVTNSTGTTSDATTGVGLSVTQDSDVYVLYSPTGTAATAGQATIVIAYATDDDL